MMAYEPSKWRTDLIVFVEKNQEIMDSGNFFFHDLGCRFENVRNGPTDKPMCTLIEFKTLKNREIKSNFTIQNKDINNYLYFMKDTNIFAENSSTFQDYYKLINDSLSKYPYAESILMAFDGYEYFKKAGYDFLIRSDMDVFLTPLFATWLPLYCNDFYVGGGGYSNTFNSKRFRRIASNLGLAYAGSNNLGN